MMVDEEGASVGPQLSFVCIGMVGNRLPDNGGESSHSIHVIYKEDKTGTGKKRKIISICDHHQLYTEKDPLE